MILNHNKLNHMLAEQARSEPIDIKRNFLLMDALYEEAKKLNVFSLDPLKDGLDVRILLGRVLNVSTAH